MDAAMCRLKQRARETTMIRKTILGIAAAAAMMAAAATSANAGVAIGIGFGGFGGYGGYGGWGPGPGYGYGYGGGYYPAYDGCRNVIVGYRTKKVWKNGMVRFIQMPIWRTRCF
jgi:hypothetical protein